MKVRDIDVEAMVEGYIEIDPNNRAKWKDVITIALKRYVEINGEREVDKQTTAELAAVINSAIEEDITSICQQLVKDKHIDVRNVNGEDRYYLKSDREK